MYKKLINVKVFSLLLTVSLWSGDCLYKHEYNNGIATATTTYIYASKSKTKSYSPYTYCATEYQTCRISIPNTKVRYGERGRYRYKVSSRNIACSNSNFGDPINGVIKKCYISVLEYACPNGYSNNGSNCKKGIALYNYTCENEENTQGLNWVPEITSGTSSTPPINNCSRKYQECTPVCESGLTWDSVDKVCYESEYYNELIIAVSTDKTVCSAYESNIGMTDTSGRVFFENYNFSDIGITKAQIDDNSLCILSSNTLLSGDELFSFIKNNNTTESLLYNTSQNLSKASCKEYAGCITGDVLTSYLGTEAKICEIRVGEDTGNEEITHTLAPPSSVIPPIEKKTGSFLSAIDGLKDIFSVQEYTEGRFGYMSNYTMALPINNVIKIGELEISPIVQHLPINKPLKYDYKVEQKTQTTKNRSPSKEDYRAEGLALRKRTDLGDGDVSGTVSWLESGENELLLGLGTGGISFVVQAIFGKKQKWGYYRNKFEIYERIGLGDKFVVNRYGYDSRFIDFVNQIAYYDKFLIHSGLRKQGDYVDFINSYGSNKKTKLQFMGYADSTIEYVTQTYETGDRIGWPSIKSYKPSGKKTRGYSFQEGLLDITKKINTIYMGAVNSLAIVVPYAGDYEVKAFDKNNNILGSRIIDSDDFISNTLSSNGNTVQSYAPVQLAMADNFNISVNQDKLIESGSCLGSKFVEWGGGVSGAYYEHLTPEGFDCKKSTDIYVESHSATKITVRPTNSDISFVIELIKPMPYPNRINLVSTLKLENRKYECWSDIFPCDPSSAVEEGN